MNRPAHKPLAVEKCSKCHYEDAYHIPIGWQGFPEGYQVWYRCSNETCNHLFLGETIYDVIPKARNIIKEFENAKTTVS